MNCDISNSSTTIADHEQDDFPVIKFTAQIDVQTCDNSEMEQLITLEGPSRFLVLSKSGKATRVDDKFGESSSIIADFKKPIKLAYNQMFGTVIAIDDRKICARREYNGLCQLWTMLDEAPHELDSIITIEFTTSESIIWKCFLSTQDLQKYSELQNFLNSLNEINGQLTQDMTDGSVLIRVIGFKIFNELTHAIRTDRDKQPDNAFATFFYAHYLLERLRLVLFPYNPYSSDNLKQNSFCHMTADQLIIQTYVDKDLMNVEAARRLSYWKWPHMDFKQAYPTQMAEAGFYHNPLKEGDDRVLCFACNVCLISWEPEDDPYQEHERHSANCKFLTLPMTSTNIPLSATMSNLAPLVWSTEKFSTTESLSDAIILGSMTGNSTWFAFCNRNNTKPSINMLHLDKITQIPYNFVIDLCDPFLANSIGLIAPSSVQIIPFFETPCTNVPSTHRRVTWSDESNKRNQNTQKLIEEDYIERKSRMPQNKHLFSINSSTIDPDIAKVTAICCAGIGPMETNNSIQPTNNGNGILGIGQRVSSFSKCFGENFASNILALGTNVTAVLYVGISIDESKIYGNIKNTNEEVSALNTMNSVASAPDGGLTPRIVELKDNRECQRCPFVLVYHLAESEIHERSTDNHAGEKQNAESSSPDSKMFEQCALETDRLLAETKKLQEQTAALENELVDLLKVDPKKQIQSEQKFGQQLADQQAMQDLIKFDDNMSINGFANLPTYIGAEQLPDKVDIVYQQNEMCSIVMQCFRLPEELDSSEFRIDQIVATTQNDGFAVFGVNRINGENDHFASAIIVYSRMEVVHMIRESYLKKFHLKMGQITQILLLPIDYFALYRAKRKIRVRNKTDVEQQIDLNGTQTLTSAILRLTNGHVLLYDLNSGSFVTVYEAIDGKYAVDITLSQNGNGVWQIIILTNEQKIKCFDVKQPLPQLSSDEHEEQLLYAIINALKDVEETDDLTRLLRNAMEKHLTPVTSVSSLVALRKLWSSHRVHNDPGLRYTHRSTNENMEMILDDFITNGVQVHAPLHWIDTNLQSQRKKRSTSSLEKDFPGLMPSTASTSRTVWSFSQTVIGQHNNVVTRAQNLVFELSILLAIPLSHIEISLQFMEPLQSTSRKNDNDDELSVWLLDTDDTNRLLNDTNNHTNGQSAIQARQTLLSLFAKQPDLLKQTGKCVCNPLSIDQLLTSKQTLTTNTANLRISASELLISTTNEQRNAGWLNQIHNYFVLYQMHNNSATSMQQTATLQQKRKERSSKKPQQQQHINNFVNTSVLPLKRTHLGTIHTINSPHSNNNTINRTLPTAFSVRVHFVDDFLPIDHGHGNNSNR